MIIAIAHKIGDSDISVGLNFCEIDVTAPDELIN